MYLLNFLFLKIFDVHIIDYPTPSNINYVWSFSSVNFLPLDLSSVIKLKLLNYLELVDISLILNITLILSIFLVTIICTYILVVKINRTFNNNLKFKKIKHPDLTTALENPVALHEKLHLFKEHAKILEDNNKDNKQYKQYKTNIIFYTPPTTKVPSYIDDKYPFFKHGFPPGFPGKELIDALVRALPSTTFHVGLQPYKRDSKEITFQIFKKIQDDLEKKYSVVSFTTSHRLGFFITNRLLPNSNRKANELEKIITDRGISFENSPLHDEPFDLIIADNPIYTQIFTHPNRIVKNIYLDIKHRDKIINLIQNKYYTVLRSTINYRGLKYYFTNFSSKKKNYELFKFWIK